MGPTLVPPWFQHVDLGSNMLPQVFKIPLNSYFFSLYRYLPESGSVPYTELVPSSQDTSFGNKIRYLFRVGSILSRRWILTQTDPRYKTIVSLR